MICFHELNDFSLSNCWYRIYFLYVLHFWPLFLWHQINKNCLLQLRCNSLETATQYILVWRKLNLLGGQILGYSIPAFVTRLTFFLSILDLKVEKKLLSHTTNPLTDIPRLNTISKKGYSTYVHIQRNQSYKWNRVQVTTTRPVCQPPA